jgi:DNA-binding NtrC family response regulator
MAGILIVDDEVELLEKIQFILEDLADEVFIAENAEQALEILDVQDNICCVIADVNMPRKTGIDLLKSARNQNFKAPFIFYSGRADDAAMVESSQYGTFDFIMKPNFQQLEDSTRLAIEIGKRILSGETVDLTKESNETFKELIQALS